MVARRLPSPLGPSSNPPRRRVQFSFDGGTYEGIAGEPLAVSLLAADRLVLSRSFRFHRPRGLMCATGQCGWCECAVDGRPSVRSCRVALREGLVARGEHAFPSVDRDLFGWLDLGSRFIPPTFYHHRFLRPRALRKRYLDVLRAFGGRGRLGAGRAGHDGPWAATARDEQRLAVEVLVVGGGPSGRAAAARAAEDEASVVLLDATPTVDRDGLAGVRVLEGTTAIGWYDGAVAAIGPTTHWSIRADSIIVATGSYERVPAVRGADRPGVMGARLVRRLLGRHGVLPGERPLLVGESGGSGELEAVAGDLAAAGARVVATVRDDELRRVLGRRRVTGAIVAGPDGRDRRVTADLVVFSARTPNLDLVLAAGAEVGTRDGVIVPVLDEAGRTSVPGLSVVGSAAGVEARPAATGPIDSAPDRALVCFCEDVHVGELRVQCAAGYGDLELAKRRTGTLTGPCQGKYCLQGFAATMAACGIDDPANRLPTARPPLQPVRLGDLVASARRDADPASWAPP